MTELEVKKMALDLMKQHGLVKEGWVFRMGRGTRCFGKCRIKPAQGLKEISISKHLSAVNTPERVKRTILHEIAHALVGIRHGHDYVWKRKCIEIGGDGQRCFSSDDTVMVDKAVRARTGTRRKHADHYCHKGITYRIGDKLNLNFDSGDKFEIIEIHTSRPKYPIIVKNTRTSKRWKVAPFQIASKVTK